MIIPLYTCTYIGSTLYNGSCGAIWYSYSILALKTIKKHCFYVILKLMHEKISGKQEIHLCMHKKYSQKLHYTMYVVGKSEKHIRAYHSYLVSLVANLW